MSPSFRSPSPPCSFRDASNIEAKSSSPCSIPGCSLTFCCMRLWFPRTRLPRVNIEVSAWGLTWIPDRLPDPGKPRKCDLNRTLLQRQVLPLRDLPQYLPGNHQSLDLAGSLVDRLDPGIPQVPL